MPKVREPSVPLDPNDSAPFVSDVLVFVVHPPAPFAVSRFPEEPPVEHPDPPLAAAQVGLAAAPCVSRKNPFVPGASAVQTVELRYRIAP